METTESRVRTILDAIAPDAGAATLAADADLREQLELDSLDVQRFVAALDAELGVAIADRDVPALRTLDDVMRLVTGPAADGGG